MHEAKSTLSKLVERAEAGEEVVIARGGVPVVKLVPIAGPARLADTRGVLRGQVHLADDFDELPDDLAEAFGMQ